MTTQLKWPPDVETRLKTHAAQHALSLEILPEHAFSTNPAAPEDLLDRRNFHKLLFAERRKILVTQAERLAPYYEQNSDGKEWLEGDLVFVRTQI